MAPLPNIGYKLRFFNLPLAFAWLAACLLQPAPLQAANRLAGHASPYLAQHATDPVQWLEWGPEALQEARRSNRLVLVSLGYYACHWCHVMQRETWADAEAARLINTQYVAVKVDREVNASLDAALQAFSERTRGIAGWPLNVFLTPEGYPLFAMTYAPREEFMQIAAALAERWRRDASTLSKLARDAAKQDAPRVISDLPRAFLSVARAEADMLRGGFGATAKFPMVPQLMALLEFQARKPDAQTEEFLRLTLRQMATGGLRDHVGGGFFRYTVDPDWHEPHFEKMLYDNAQLGELYLRAAEVLKEPAYRRIGLETVDFMLAEMTVDKGSAARGLVASLSALDEKGREGGVYLWDKSALRRILGPQDYALLERVWGLERAAVFEGGYLPLEMRAPTQDERPRMDAVLARLKGVRQERIIPRDVKVLAGWNGLALAAFSAAARIEPRYRRHADALYDFVRSSLWDGKRLSKGGSGARVLPGAELEDYAYLAHGVARYAAALGRDDAWRFLRTLQAEAWRRFHDGKAFRMEETSMLASDHADAWEDGHTPAPAAVLTRVSRGLGGTEAKRGSAAWLSARANATGNPLWRASLARPD